MSTYSRITVLWAAMAIGLSVATVTAADVAKAPVNDRDKKDSVPRVTVERSSSARSDSSKSSSGGPAANRGDSGNRNGTAANGGRSPAISTPPSRSGSSSPSPSYNAPSANRNGWRDGWDRDQSERDRWDRDRDERDRREDRENRDRNYSYADPYASRFFSGTGTLVSASPGLLQVNANGTTWRIKANVGAKFEVVGTAGPDFLKPGLFVKFQAPFDANDNNSIKALAPVTTLEIITPHAGEMPGAVPAGETKGAMADAKNNVPLPATARSLVVIGRITSYRNKELTVSANNRTLKADLDPVTIIKVRVSDPSFAHRGDQVEVDGFYLKPGYAVANQVLITLAAPLGDPLSEFGKQNPPAKPVRKLAAAQQ